MLAMVSCGKHEFSGNLDDDKNMTINAVNADTVKKNNRSQHVIEKVGFKFIKEDDRKARSRSSLSPLRVSKILMSSRN